MTRGDAERLLALSREARWAFPSSFGNPVRGKEPWVAGLVAEQSRLPEAARVLREGGDEDAAVELGANAWRLWVLSRDPAGGRAFLAAALDGGVGAPSRARALALYGDGLLAQREGAHGDSRRRNEAALESARAAGDPEALALAHLGLSRVAFEAADYDAARSLAAAALEHAQPLDEAFRQGPLHLHAQSIRLGGELERAAALLAESLELNRRIDDPGMQAVELHNLGFVEARRGNADAAERLFAECVALASDDDPYDVAMAHLQRAAVAFARGDRDAAGGHLPPARAVLDESGVELAPDDRRELDRLAGELAR